MERQRTLTFALVAVSLLGAVFLTYQNYSLKSAYLAVAESGVRTAEELTTENMALRSTVAELEGHLGITRSERDELEEDLREEKEKFESLDDQIRDISGTVGKLDKLARTDPELLQKYSKVFFLNEHYSPEKLATIKKAYLYNEGRDQQLHFEVYPFFEDMVEDALDDDIKLYVVSAFRSFSTQAELKGRYTVIYGTGANAFSADQGYSEHQLGTTVDFTTVGINGGLNGFENTDAYRWLLENAHKYGFVLSYPENNAYYVYEPWHWRFVGTDLARDLHRDGKHFYDLDQREIDQYLISIFD